MFDLFFKGFAHRSYKVYYTCPPGTFVLLKVIQARSVYEANRIFDQHYSTQYVRVPNATVLY